MNGYTKLGTMALILLAFAAGLPMSAHCWAKRKVEAYRQYLRAKGEKLTTGELRPRVSAEALNGGRALLDAANHLGYPNVLNLPPTVKIVSPGRAMVSWEQAELPTMESSNLWPDLSRMLAGKKEQMDALRAALTNPMLAFDLDYSKEANLRLGFLPTLQSVAQWFSAATVLNLHEGHPSNASDDVKALSALVAHSLVEPVMISELIRMAIGTVALSATWEALQSPALQEAQLSDIQKAWESVDLLGQAEAVLVMERPFVELNLADWRRQSYAVIVTSSWGYHPMHGLKKLFHRYPGSWAWRWWQSYDDELVSLETLQAGIEAAHAARQNRFVPALQQFDQKIESIQRAHPAADRWLGFPPQGTTDRFLYRIEVFEAQRSLLITAVALKRYQLRHGTYPAELVALTPEFLRRLPLDPMDGQPLRYRINPDGSFLLYSVGQDGQDDGGDPTPAPPASSRQWWVGRDVVWPWPATAEMVKADFEKERIRREERMPPSAKQTARAFARRNSPRLTPPSTGTNTTR
jgi:hypothetical protein